MQVLCDKADISGDLFVVTGDSKYKIWCLKSFEPCVNLTYIESDWQIADNFNIFYWAKFNIGYIEVLLLR